MVFTMPGLVVVIHMSPLFMIISMMVVCFAVLAFLVKDEAEEVVQLTEEDSLYGIP